ncbi:MAG: hypothetical protein IJJ33_10175 [Victivallales bacterium]|nr:hypothetical protein [Victivallales bacterium]
MKKWTCFVPVFALTILLNLNGCILKNGNQSLPASQIEQKSDPDGDPKIFGAINSRENIMNPANWQGRSDNLAVERKDGRIRFAWNGATFEGETAIGPLFDATPDAIIRGDLCFQKLKWTFGSEAIPKILFYDSNGKLILEKRFDSSNIPGYSPMMLTEAHDELALNVPVNYFNYWQVPKETTCFRIGWTLCKSASSIRLDRLAFRNVDPSLKSWKTQPPMPKDLYPHQRRECSDTELDQIVAGRPRLYPKLVRQQDRVKIQVDGETVYPAIYHTNSYLPGTPLEFYPSMRKAGFRIMDIWVGTGKCHGSQHEAMNDDGSIDVTPWRTAVRKILREAPDALVFLAVKIFPERDWLMAHPELWMTTADGIPFIYGYPYYPMGKNPNHVLPKGHDRIPSMFSDIFISHITQKLANILREFEKTPESKAVAGIYLVGFDDAQFRSPNISFTPDASKAALSAYRAWLKNKYQTDTALQKAWNDPNTTIDAVQFPSREQLWADRPYYRLGEASPEADYKMFYVSGERKFKNALRKTAKEAAPRLLAGNYDCTFGALGSWGHTGFSFRETLDAPGDFSIWLPSYGRDRDGDGMALQLYQYPGSLLLRNKLCIMEHDYRHPEMPKLYFGHYTARNWQAVHNRESFRNALLHATAFTTALGGGYHFYSLQNSWLKPADSIPSIAAARKVADSASGDSSQERIAIMCDDDSTFYNTIHPSWIPAFFNVRNFPVWNVQKSGIAFNVYEAHDALDDRFDAPKVLYFSDAGTLTPNDVAAIRKKWGRDGRVLVWQGTPSFLVTKDQQAIDQALGTKIRMLPDNFPKMLKAEPSDAEPLLRNLSGYMVQWPTIRDPYRLPPRWEIADPTAVRVLNYQGTDHCGLAVKRHKGFTEVFLGQPGAVSPQLFRNIAAEAGIRPVLDTDDIVLIGGGLLSCTGSIGNGVRRLRMPVGTKDFIPLTGQKILRRGKDWVEINLKYRETAVFQQVFNQ